MPRARFSLQSRAEIHTRKKTNLFLENKSKCHNDKQNWRFWPRIDQKGHKIAIYVDHRTVGFYNNKKYIRKFACV